MNAESGRKKEREKKPFAHLFAPWKREELVIFSNSSHLFSSKNIVLKDPSLKERVIAREDKQFSFKISNYASEADAFKHALLMARFHRLLAEKGYFHPKTVFGIYASGLGGRKVFRIFAVMPRLEPLEESRKTKAEIKRVGGILFDFLKKHGLSQRLLDYDISKQEPTYVFNFGRDEKTGGVHAMDLELWSFEDDVPTAQKLEKILKKEGIDVKRLLEKT